MAAIQDGKSSTVFLGNRLRHPTSDEGGGPNRPPPHRAASWRKFLLTHATAKCRYSRWRLLCSRVSGSDPDHDQRAPIQFDISPRSQ
jgi:hypothetical protein